MQNLRKEREEPPEAKDFELKPNITFNPSMRLINIEKDFTANNMKK